MPVRGPFFKRLDANGPIGSGANAKARKPHTLLSLKLLEAAASL